MKIDYLNIRDAEVQRFLWEHVAPSDFRFDYTRFDALKWIEENIYTQRAMLVGDMEAGIAFYCVQRNEKVVEPHIMGNAAYMRSALDQGCAMAWKLGYERVVIWTQHQAIARIVEGCGFTLNGQFPKLHMEADKSLADLYVLSFDRGAEHV